MRRAVLCLAVALVLMLPAATARAAEPTSDEVRQRISDAVSKQMDQLNLSGWEEFLDDSVLSGQDARSVLEQILDQGPMTALESLLNGSRDLVTGALRQSLLLLMQLLAVIVFSAVLQRTAQAMEPGDAARGAEIVLYLCMAGILASGFFSMHKIATQAMEQMAAFFDYLFPILTVLLAATGGIATAAGLQPTLALAMQALRWVLSAGVLPAILASGALVLVDNIAMEQRLAPVVGLLKSLCKWSLGAVMTVLTAIISIQGASLAGYDGISIRTAKYTVDAMVPVVGGMLSDLAEVLVAGSALVKNAVGSLGLITLLALVARPLLEMTAFLLTLRLAGAMAAPLGAKRISTALDECAGVAVLWLVALIVMAAFLFMLIFITVAVGNAILMYR